MQLTLKQHLEKNELLLLLVVAVMTFVNCQYSVVPHF